MGPEGGRNLNIAHNWERAVFIVWTDIFDMNNMIICTIYVQKEDKTWTHCSHSACVEKNEDILPCFRQSDRFTAAKSLHFFTRRRWAVSTSPWASSHSKAVPKASYAYACDTVVSMDLSAPSVSEGKSSAPPFTSATISQSDKIW